MSTKANELNFILPWLRICAEQGSIVDRACAFAVLIALGEGAQPHPAARKLLTELTGQKRN